MELILVVVISVGMAENSQNGVSRSLNKNQPVCHKSTSIFFEVSRLIKTKPTVFIFLSSNGEYYSIQK